MLQLFIYLSAFLPSSLWCLFIQSFLDQSAYMPFFKKISIWYCASIPWCLCVCQSVYPNIFTYINAHLFLHPSLFASRACPLVLLAWCLMEPVPHTGPLRSPTGAAMEPLIHQSPCSWQETDPRGTVPPGQLEPRWLTGPQRKDEDKGKQQVEVEDERVGACETVWEERYACVSVCVVFSLRYNNREHLCRKETPFPPPSFLTQTLQQCSLIVWTSLSCGCVCVRMCVSEREASMELKGDFMVLSWYTKSTVKGNRVNKHSTNGFIGLHVIPQHTSTHTNTQNAHIARARYPNTCAASRAMPLQLLKNTRK